MRKLPRKFYNRSAMNVAIDLLGCRLISNLGGIKTGGMIVEAEAYIGEDDPACHASHGLTKRNRTMYGPPGFLYVYFTYGNHYMLNVVADRKGYPSAVLLRGVEPLFNIGEMARRRGVADYKNISSGPGKIAKALNVTTKQDGIDLCRTDIYITGQSKAKREICASPRIGVGDKGADKLWRFFINGNPHVSRAPGYVQKHTFPLLEARTTIFSLKD